MNRDVSDTQDATAMPDSAANAWAAVYIDVAEKLDAEDQAAQQPSPGAPDATPTSPSKPHGRISCTAT